MSKVTVRQHQTIWDISIQETGSIEAAFAIVARNGIDINTPLSVGQVLHVDSPVVNVAVVEHYRQQGIRPANGLSLQELAIIGGDFDWDDFDGDDFDSAPPMFDFHWPDFHEEDFEA